MSGKRRDEQFERLAELTASAFKAGERRAHQKERDGFVSVLDDALEAHAAFAAVAGLAGCARDDQGSAFRLRAGSAAARGECPPGAGN
jgi:hypothetical protein